MRWILFQEVLTHRVYDGKDIDHENHNPPPSTRIAMNALRSIQHAHDNHACEQDQAAVDGGGPAAPSIDEDYSYDGEGKDAYSGNPRGKESGFRRVETGLFEEQRCILRKISSTHSLTESRNGEDTNVDYPIYTAQLLHSHQEHSKNQGLPCLLSEDLGQFRDVATYALL